MGIPEGLGTIGLLFQNSMTYGQEQETRMVYGTAYIPNYQNWSSTSCIGFR